MGMMTPTLGRRHVNDGRRRRMEVPVVELELGLEQGVRVHMEGVAVTWTLRLLPVRMMMSTVTQQGTRLM